jgi:hypothetical protein
LVKKKRAKLIGLNFSVSPKSSTLVLLHDLFGGFEVKGDRENQGNFFTQEDAAVRIKSPKFSNNQRRASVRVGCVCEKK